MTQQYAHAGWQATTLMLMLVAVGDACCAEGTRPEHGFPRLMGMNIGGPIHYVNPVAQDELAQHDIVILGFYPGWSDDFRSTSPAAVVAGLKRRNRKLLVGQYTILQELVESDAGERGRRAAYVARHRWWLVGADGDRRRWTDDYGAWDINITRGTKPDARGDRYPQWLAKEDYTTFFSRTPQVDIWYVDNVLSASAVRRADWDMDGVDEGNQEADVAAAYQQGQVEHWAAIRSLAPSVLIVGNVDRQFTGAYSGRLDGAFLEALMGLRWSTETREGWAAMMARYSEAFTRTGGPRIVGFNVHGRRDDFQLMRFGLASCLLNDGYFAYSEIDANYRTVVWFDEFDLELGRPLSVPVIPDDTRRIYRRDFERGVVLVNPSRIPVKVDLGGRLYRFRGRQDPVANNGAAVSTAELQGRDGLILMRSPHSLQ